MKIKRMLLSILLVVPSVVVSCEVKAVSNETKGNGNIDYFHTDIDTTPMDPENPTTPVDPGNEIVSTKGFLRFDVIPALHFGPQAVSSKDEIYSVNAQLFKDDTEARPNYIQVTDARATYSGWEISVKQETEFIDINNSNKKLEGAMLSFDDQWINSTSTDKEWPTVSKDTIKINNIGATYPVAKAVENTGSGTWIIAFGSSGNVEGRKQTLSPLLNAKGTPVTDANFNNKTVYKNSGIKLHVPGKTQKELGKYQTELTWTISELPK